MPSNEDYRRELDRASKVLLSLAGEDVDAIDVKSFGADEAPFLAKIVSKLSPMVGNLMEQRVASILDQDASDGFSWLRQDPGFPDAILTHEHGAPTNTGYEIKAWYVLSTELTGRFKESQNLLAGKNIDVVVIAWCMSHMVFGKPKILGILTVPGSDVARDRDLHYHQPPEYLCMEPQDTTERTANLQQSNVNGFKLQVADTLKANPQGLKDARKKAEQGLYTAASNTPAAQAESLRLMSDLTYRLDTNFAKLDRVDNDEVEIFKKKILAEKYLDKTIAQWKSIFANLNGKTASGTACTPAQQIRAERIIVDLYGQMVSEEPKTEIVIDSGVVG